MTFDETFRFISVPQLDTDGGESGLNINNQQLEGYLERFVTEVNALDARVVALEGSASLTREFFAVALSDETTAISTGTAAITFRVVGSYTLHRVRASLSTAGSGSTVVDINVNGSTILSTKLSLDASERTSTTAALQPVLTVSTLSDDDEITIDIDTAGASAAGLKVYFDWTRTAV